MPETSPRFELSLPGGKALGLGPEPGIMGILNVTPDSFSDGGSWCEPDRAVEHGLSLIREGAALIDVGGESTRPGADPVQPEEEAARVVPVIEALASQTEVPISVDTRRGAVARAALRAGAALVNDVSGARDPDLVRAAAEAGAPVIVMHMRGTPADMAGHTDYEDIVGEVTRELAEAVARAVAGGVPEEQVIVDPGIGFAKTAEQSLTLIRELARLHGLGRPILVGPSRKSFLGAIVPSEPADRLYLTLGALTACAAAGAHLLRVHDVRPAVEAVTAFGACRRP